MKIRLLILLAFFPLLSNATQYLSFTNGYEDSTVYNVKKTAIKYESYFEISYTFEGLCMDNYTYNGKTYKGLKMQGASYISSLGDPELPIFIDLLITNSDSCSIEMVDATYNEFDNVMVKPTKGKILEMAKHDNTIKFSNIYDSDMFFPKSNAEIIEVHQYKSIPYIGIQVNPIQYNPKTSKIRCYKSITFRIVPKSKQTWTSIDFDVYDELRGLMSGSGLNVQDRTGIPRPQKAPHPVAPVQKEKADYLIVTTDELVPYVDKLVRWKTMQGFKCHVISQNKWSSSTEVHYAISSFYEKEHPEYLLIFGDHENVPSVEFLNDTGWVRTIGVDPIYLSDAPYAGGSCLLPNMCHGRIPTKYASDANIVVDKIINYERYPIEDDYYYNHATHCSFAQDNDEKPDGYEDRVFVSTSEKIRDYMIGWGKTIAREYNSDYFPKYYNQYYCNGEEMPAELLNRDAWTGNAKNITDDISKGNFYALYRAHGWYDSWGSVGFSTYDIEKLTNKNKLSVVFSITCLSGGFHKDKCLAEKFLLEPNTGAVGVIAASNVSYSYWNDAFLIGMFNTMLTNPGIENYHGDDYSYEAPNTTFEMGKVLRSGFIQMYNSGFKDPGCLDFTCREYHYFGDPSMEIYTEVPACFDPQITQNGTTVTVKTGDVNGCKIVLSSQSGDVIQVMNGSNSAIFTNVTYPYNIVISKHNYKPYVMHSVNYLQDENIEYDRDVLADSIYAGTNVTTSYKSGDVVVNGGKLTLMAKESIHLLPGFRTNGGDMLASLGYNYDCPFGYNEPISNYVPRNTTSAHDGDGIVHHDVVLDNEEITETNDTRDTDDILYVNGNTLVINLTNPSDVEISDILGRTVFIGHDITQQKVKLNHGIYTVKYGNIVKKIMITEGKGI